MLPLPLLKCVLIDSSVRVVQQIKLKPSDGVGDLLSELPRLVFVPICLVELLVNWNSAKVGALLMLPHEERSSDVDRRLWIDSWALRHRVA